MADSVEIKPIGHHILQNVPFRFYWEVERLFYDMNIVLCRNWLTVAQPLMSEILLPEAEHSKQSWERDSRGCMQHGSKEAGPDCEQGLYAFLSFHSIVLLFCIQHAGNSVLLGGFLLIF